MNGMSNAVCDLSWNKIVQWGWEKEQQSGRVRWMEESVGIDLLYERYRGWVQGTILGWAAHNRTG